MEINGSSTSQTMEFNISVLSQSNQSVDNQNYSKCPSHTEEEADLLHTLKYVLEGILMLFLSTIGLLANSLSIFVLTRKNLSNKTFNQLLTALAIFDTIFLLMMFYESAGKSFKMEESGDHHRTWWYIRALLTPYFLYPVKAMSMTGSVFVMLSIAFERYMAVCKPFTRIPDTLQQFGTSQRKQKRRNRLLIYLLPVVLCSIIFNIPKFFESKFNGDPKMRFIEVRPLRSNTMYLIVNSWARLVLIGIVPVVIVSFLNYHIYHGIHKFSPQLRKSKTKKADDTLSIVLTFVVIIFVLCSLPRLILMMYEVTVVGLISECIKLSTKRPLPFWNHFLGFVSHNLLVLNPFLNFLVYCVVGKTFRRVAAEYMFKICPCLSKYMSSSTLNKGSKKWSFVGPQDGLRNSRNSNSTSDQRDNANKKNSYRKRKSESYFGIVKETETLFNDEQKCNLVNVQCNNKVEEIIENEDSRTRNKVRVSVEIEFTHSDSKEKEKNKMASKSKHLSDNNGLVLKNWQKETLL